ncbi:hypothetical protein [Shewanella sp. 30m-9]
MDVLKPKKAFSTSNFSAVNDAIDVEVDKRGELSRLYSSQRTLNKSMIGLLITSSIAIVVLMVVVIYWLFFFSTPPPSIVQSFDKQTSQSLKEIAKANTDPDKVIDTSFTVFLRSQIETGEYVVTGKNYLPDNLVEPLEQYCYLEPQEAATSLAGETIASMSDGVLSVETTDKFLLGLALPHCQFYTQEIP